MLSLKLLSSCKLWLEGFNIEISHDEADSVVSNVYAFAFGYDSFVIWEQFKLLLICVFVFKGFKVVVNLPKSQF